MLVTQRATDGEWELPGGRLEPAEDPADGLEREIAEETDLAVDITEIVSANSWINDDGNGRFAVHYYCRTPHRDVAISTEHVEAQWISLTHAQELVCKPQAAAIEAASRSATTALQPSDPRSISQD